MFTILLIKGAIYSFLFSNFPKIEWVTQAAPRSFFRSEAPGVHLYLY